MSWSAFRWAWKMQKTSSPIWIRPWRLFEQLHIFLDPLQIFLAAAADFQLDTLRQLVGMEFFDPVANAGEIRLQRLDHQQPLVGDLYFALPPVDGVNLRDNIHAGGELALHQRLGDLSGLFLRPCCR